MQNPAVGREEPLAFPRDGLTEGSSTEKCLECGKQDTERAPAVRKAGSILGFVNRSKARKLREVTIPFSGLARPRLGTASSWDL